MSGIIILWSIATMTGSTVGAVIGTTIGEAIKNKMNPTVVEVVVPCECGVEINPDIMESIKTLL